MDNPETLTTQGTQDEDKQTQKHNTTQKTKKMSNTDPPKLAVNPGVREG